jgi:multisubunit Na+/H+ antiporter MnhC subunit
MELFILNKITHLFDSGFFLVQSSNALDKIFGFSTVFSPTLLPQTIYSGLHLGIFWSLNKTLSEHAILNYF